MKRQAGLSMLGFFWFLLIAGLVAFVGMRLFPVYSEYQGVVSAMNGLASDPDASGKSLGELRKMLSKRLQINYVENVKPENIKVEREGSSSTLMVAYEVRRPLVYNLDFVAKFEKKVPMRNAGSQLK